VLVIGGTHDVFCSAPQSERIAERIPGAELVIFDECGHFPELEVPDQFFAAIEAWLARLA
jgi:pimeloyl-ACP methyl ester carboxylesterase